MKNFVFTFGTIVVGKVYSPCKGPPGSALLNGTKAWPKSYQKNEKIPGYYFTINFMCPLAFFCFGYTLIA